MIFPVFFPAMKGPWVLYLDILAILLVIGDRKSKNFAE